MYLAERNKYVQSASFVFNNEPVRLVAQWYPEMESMYVCFYKTHGYEQGTFSKRGYSIFLKNISNDTKTQFKVLGTRNFKE